MTTLALRPLSRTDGPAMHAINRACPIEADFTFYFDREPDFFAWPDALFDDYLYIGGFAGAELVAYALFGSVIGRGAVGVGRLTWVGDARVLPEARGHAFAEQAARAWRALAPAPTIVIGLVKRGNAAAHASLGKLTLPEASHARLCAYDAANVLLARRTGGARRFAVRRARPDDVPRLAALLERAYEGRLFAPVMSPEELTRDIAHLPGFAIDSYWLAFAGSELVGALAVWDASAIRRARVLRLAPLARLLRAAYGAARLVFRVTPPLPGPGEAFRMLTTTHVGVPTSDPAILRDLIAAVHDHHLGRGYHAIVIGFTGDDPLTPALRGFLVQHFRSDVVVFAEPPVLARLLGEARPYVDLRFV